MINLKKMWHFYPVAAHFVEFNHPIDSLRCIGSEKVSLPPRGDNLDVVTFQKGALLDPLSENLVSL